MVSKVKPPEGASEEQIAALKKLKGLIIKPKFFKGKGRTKGEGLTLTEGLTEGEGLVQTDPNISLKKRKPVKLKLKLKTTFSSHGSKAKPRGVGKALKGYGRAMK